MPHMLNEAAKAVGKDRTTLLRAVRSGKLSYAPTLEATRSSTHMVGTTMTSSAPTSHISSLMLPSV
jgi:hypothetical protein